MNKVQRIGDVAAQFNISSRTLRYYEEIGLLWSERRDFSPFRYYDAEAMRRLEQILLLRRLDLPIKEICEIFASRDMQVAVDSFARKLQSLEAEIERLTALRQTVDSFLTLLKEKGYLQQGEFDLLQEEAPPLLDAAMRKENSMTPHEVNTTLSHVRIVELKPMKVACYRHVSASPEHDAWKVMLDWAQEKGILDLPTTRCFGFNNPNPSHNRPEYGYEVWVTVPDGVEPSGPIQIKEFKGGLYAAAPTWLYEIGERWQKLVQWAKDNRTQYEATDEQCLEETINPSLTLSEEVQLDLLLPIRRK